MKINLPELKVDEKEIKIRLAISMLEDGSVSLGKAARIAGYSERTFAEILHERTIPSIRYENIDLEKELENA